MMALYTNKMVVSDCATSLAYNNHVARKRNGAFYHFCRSYREGRNSLIELVCCVGGDGGGCGTGSYHSSVIIIMCSRYACFMIYRTLLYWIPGITDDDMNWMGIMVPLLRSWCWFWTMYGSVWCACFR